MEWLLNQALNPILAFTEGDRWRPGIGDPTFMGWFTVFAYFATGFLCWRAAKKETLNRNVRLFWLALTTLLILLGFNKQLDLQTAFTFIAKDFAKSTGWYENRRVVQGIFVLCIAVGGIASVAWLSWIFRNDLARMWRVFVGLGFLLSFIVIRAASFHYIDQFLRSGPGTVRMNWILELGAIAAIAWPAFRAAKRPATTYGSMTRMR